MDNKKFLGNQFSIKLKLFIAFIILFIIGLVFFLSNKFFLVSSVSNSVPLDFLVTYHMGGGMRYHSETIIFSSTTSYWEVMDQSKITHYALDITPSELGSIYQFIFKKSFFKLTDSSSNSAVTDQGSNSIAVVMNGEKHSVLRRGESFVSTSSNYWWDQYDSIGQAIMVLAERHRSDVPDKN